MKKQDVFVKVIGVLFLLFWLLMRTAPNVLPGAAVLAIFFCLWISCAVFVIIKSYKKTSEEEKKAQEQSRPSRPTVRGSLTGMAGLAITVVVMTRKGVGVVFYVFCAVALLVFLVQLLLALRDRNAQEEERSSSERVYTAIEKIGPIIISIFGIGFCVVWCWMAISHGAWFVAPLGLLMGIAVAAPAVNAIAERLRSARSEDSAFSNKEEEPWDQETERS